MTRFVAVDWSGKAVGAQETIWIAEVADGRLGLLENGRDRDAVIAWLIARAEDDPQLVVGLDFAFSFPAWYCRERGWRSGSEVWSAIRDDGEALLGAGADPFWGRPGVANRLAPERRWRRTEREDAPRAKSVFQIGGSGAVGTGSIRGMGHLLTLAEHGFAVWPFQGAGPPLALEIYPRLLYPRRRVVKSRWSARRALVFECFAGQPADMLERAAGSEDAFDAAVSALIMARHADALAALGPDPAYALEGRVWAPPPGEP